MDAGGVPEALVPYCQTTRHYIPERHDISKHQIRIFSTWMLFTIISQLAPFIPATEFTVEHTHTRVHVPAHCSWIRLQGRSCSEAVHRPINKCSHCFLSWPWVIRSSRYLIHIQIKLDERIIPLGRKDNFMYELNASCNTYGRYDLTRTGCSDMRRTGLTGQYFYWCIEGV